MLPRMSLLQTIVRFPLSYPASVSVGVEFYCRRATEDCFWETRGCSCLRSVDRRLSTMLLKGDSNMRSTICYTVRES